MEQRLTLITLGVADLQVAADFYENIFGWKRSGNSWEDIIFFQLNGIQLALYPKGKLAEDVAVSPVSTGFSGFTLAYDARSESEVDELVAQLEEKGVAVIKRPQKVFWGGYSSFIADPEGNLWEIAYNPYLPLDEKGNVRGINE